MNQILFMSGIGFQEIMTALSLPAFFLLIFIALRSVFLWYWKVNTIITNQEIQIKLLTDLILLNKGTVQAESTLSVEEKAKLFDQLNKR